MLVNLLWLILLGPMPFYPVEHSAPHHDCCQPNPQRAHINNNNNHHHYNNTLTGCYLLLADLLVGAEAYDEALDVLHKSLTYNKTSAKAWELMGFVCEKQQAFKVSCDRCCWCCCTCCCLGGFFFKMGGFCV